MENIQSLESEIRELGKKCDLESVLREELNLEIQTLQRSQLKSSWNIQPVSQESVQISQQIDPVQSGTLASLQVSSVVRSGTSPTPPTYVIQSVGLGSTENLNATTALKDQSAMPNQASYSYQPTTSVKYSIEGPIVSEVALRREAESSAQTTNQNKAESVAPIENTNSEINRILARIEQDNRILAELEKSRATVDLPLVTTGVNATKEDINKERNVPLSASTKQSVTRQELEQLMAKLEQDNRILAELDKKRDILESFSTSLSTKSASFVANNGFQSHHSIMPSSSPSLGSLRDPAVSLNLQGLTGSASSTSLHHALVPTGHSLLPTSLFQRFTTGSMPPDVTLTEEEMLDSIDFIELPGRGRCNIFCARYTYDPLKQSPNENPEAELALNAGDYVIIYGEMDEDGFFNGELLDGRKGLVPSNFVEKLTGEELFEFHATVLYGNRDSDESSVSFSYAQDMEMTVSDDFLQPEDFHRMNDYVDLDDIEEVDQDNEDVNVEKNNENFALGVPPPQRLILERQMNKSLLIGWVPPDVAPGKIEGYHVYVDGVPKATIQFSERTRALIEGVDSSRPHRVSVRSISSAGFHSKDAACTIVVGKDFPLAPTCVKASHITASSALISWLPSNSNFQHVIAVNSVEVKIVKPGCFRHHVTGLSPNTVYRVSVRVKPGKLLYNDEKNPKKLEMLVSNVEFRTLPKGLPDPPVNVSVEQGPQDGSILVTWLPVMTNPASSIVSPVIGYAVFAAGRKVAEIESPTGDHALIDGQQLLPLNKKSITVKSKSVDGFSGDSLVCVVPNELLRSVQKNKPKMLCKVESINEVEDLQTDEMEKDNADLQDYPSKSSHTVRRLNQNVMNTQVVNQRRQGWKDQSYNSRSIQGAEGNGVMEPRNRREHRNASRQIVLDPDENLSDKEIYPSARGNIPSIAGKEGSQNYKITRDTTVIEDCEAGFSDDEYDPRRRRSQKPTSPERYAGTSSQQRPLRTEHDTHYSPNSRSHRGPQPMHHHSQQHTHRERQSPRRQSLDSALGRNQPPLPNQPVPGKQRVSQQSHNLQDQNRRNHSSAHVGSRSGHPPPTDRGPNHSYYNKRRGSENLVNPPSHSSRKMPDFPEAMSRYEDQSDFDSYSSNVDEGDNRVRFFVALFDYDPQTMSPNPDAADEELPFQEGQMIKIYGDKDSDGFYRGESNGRIGLVPGNMVSEVQIDGESIPFNDNIPRPRPMAQLGMLERDDEWSDRRIKKMIAIYDYDPQEISPNVDSEMELSFSVGDVIYVIGEVDEDGFYIGELNGIKGLVPSNFMREVPIEEDDKRPINSRPKGTSRDDFHRKSLPEAMEHGRKHGRNSEKLHYPTSSGHKGPATSSGYTPPTTLWDENEFDREPATRGPHVPPRSQRLGHSQNFPEPSPHDQHW